MKNKKRLFARVLSFAMSLMMALSVSNYAVPAFADDAEEVRTLSFEQVDNSEVDASLLLGDDAVVVETQSDYADNDVVRVSIVLAEDSALDAGYSFDNILENVSALKHLKQLEKYQAKVEKELKKAAKKGLKVKHNLTLAADIISAEVTYSEISKIEAMSDVKEVIIETQYSPCVDETVAGPQMAVSTGVMTGAKQAWTEGYTGSGARIAIIDTGLDIDHQSFNNDAFLYALSGGASSSNIKNAKALQNALKNVLNKLSLLDETRVKLALPYLNAYKENASLTASQLRVSDKIPFAYNYVDGDLDVRHINDTQGEHGSHVAGIAAANRYLNVNGKYVDAIDSVGVAGNAPDAQVLVMKVFGKGGGAYDSDYMAAIEDAIILGCDSVNLSLGSGNAGMATSATYQEILDKLVSTSTVVVMSAGNSGAWAEQTVYGDLYVDGVNFDTAGSPGSFTNSLGVASVNNAGSYGPTMSVAGAKYGYTETSGYGNAPIATLADGKSYEYVFINGFGTPEDFDGVDVAGKVVFVKRGTTSFFEKANNAVANGAVATVVYNNQAGSISMNLTGYEYTAPCVSITEADGAEILAASTAVNDHYSVGTLSFDSENTLILSKDDYYTMSSFSSWGVPGTLELKPEITAPGGNIYSVNGLNNAGGGHDQYELMSGTSMAAPQVTGMAAVLKRYIEESGMKLKGLVGIRLTHRALAQSLLMSTATPMKDAEGYYYSVLQQGAGLANVYDAMHASTVVAMADNATASAKDGKVKVELGDDPIRRGVYSFSFTLTNISKSNVTYDLSLDAFTQATDGTFLYGDTMPIDVKTAFTVDGKKATSVTVKKNKTAVVSVVMALTDDTKELFDTYYTGGAYVEAYVNAKARDNSSDHSIPVLGFYGSWTDSSMFDLGSYQEYKYGLENRPPYLYNINKLAGNAYTVQFNGDSQPYYFGGNLFATDTEYHPEFASLNNTNGDMIKAVNYALIRNAGMVKTIITNAETGEVYAENNIGSKYSAYYYTNGAAWRNTANKADLNWKGTDANGNQLPEGTKVNINVVAAPEYYVDKEGNIAMDKLSDGAFFGTSLTIDNTAPEVVSVADETNGSILVAATDNLAIAAIMLYSQNGKTLIGRAAVGTDKIVTALGSGLEDDVYLLAVADYAGNVSTYRVFMGVQPTDEVESFEISETSLTLMKNNAAQLFATIAPDNISDETVLWTSSDETVAVVDANGVVKAVGVGNAVITATAAIDEEFTATCDVEVIEISIDLNGFVWDEDGSVWLSKINTASLPSYEKLSAAKLDTRVNASAYGVDGTLYVTDLDTDNGVSNLYKFDAATCEAELVGTSEIGYTELAEAPHLNALMASYFNYLVLVDPETGDYMGAFNYLSSGASIVGVTYIGSLLNTYYNEYLDLYYILDSDGNLYEEAFICLDGSYYYFSGEEDALMGSTGIATDADYFQSLYFNGEYTFASNFSEARNTVVLYAIDTESTGAVYMLGEFADGVWPVAGLCELGDVAASSANAAKFADAEVAGAVTFEAPAPQSYNCLK